MKLKSIGPAILALLLAACGGSGPAASSLESTAGSGLQTDASVASASESSVNGNAGPACPSANFDEFAKAFMADVEVQKAFTHVPLLDQYVDASAEPEPATIRRELAAGAIRFPVMPDAAQQREDGLHYRVEPGDRPDQRTLVLAKPDTDYLLKYLFRKEQCWVLYEKRNYSLSSGTAPLSADDGNGKTSAENTGESVLNAFVGDWAYEQACGWMHSATLSLRLENGKLVGDWSDGNRVGGGFGKVVGNLQGDRLYLRFCDDSGPSKGGSECPTYDEGRRYLVVDGSVIKWYEVYGDGAPTEYLELHSNAGGKKVPKDYDCKDDG